MVLKSFQLLLVTIALVFPTSTLSAPITSLNDHHDQGKDSIDRNRRQTLGEAQIVQIMEMTSDTDTEVCPDYGDDECEQIEDLICLPGVFKEATHYWRRVEQEQASVQAIHQCALINPHSGNNLRSHYQDLVSLTSMFRSVGQPGILPNANYSEVLCQLENTVFDLNKTIDNFCEFSRENCSEVKYSCANDFPQNANRDVQFNATCNRELVQSLQQAMRYITSLMLSSIPDTRRPACVAKSVRQCIRASSGQVDVLNAFKETLVQRIFNISMLDAQIMNECKPKEELYDPDNTTVFEVYNALVDTVALLGSLNTSLPSQQDLFMSLNSTVLPLIKEMLLNVAVNEGMLKDMSVPYSLSVQLENVTEPDTLTVCVVTRLNKLYNLTLSRLKQLSFIKVGGYCHSL